MTAGLLLDGLLLLVVAFYIPIGFWRGGPREALLGGAILLGAATASAWAPSWGDRLADATSIEETTARFLVALAILLLVGLGLGYGAGAFAGRTTPGPESRLAGAALGMVNALLLLGFALTFLTDFLHEGEPNETVEAGWFADGLATRLGWFLLVACLLGGGLTIAYRVAARFEHDLIEQTGSPEAGRGLGPRRRLAVAPPADPDGGKVEPDWEPMGGTDAPGAGWALRASTRPVVATVPTTEDGGSRIAATNGVEAAGRGGAAVVDDWLRRAAASERPASDAEGTKAFPFPGATLSNLLGSAADRGRPPAAMVDPLAGFLPPVEAEAEDAPRAAGDGLEPVRRCRVCGTPAATDLRECAFCGETLHDGD